MKTEIFSTLILHGIRNEMQSLALEILEDIEFMSKLYISVRYVSGSFITKIFINLDTSLVYYHNFSMDSIGLAQIEFEFQNEPTELLRCKIHSKYRKTGAARDFTVINCIKITNIKEDIRNEINALIMNAVLDK